jgi:PAS domain S-box-containing protein
MNRVCAIWPVLLGNGNIPTAWIIAGLSLLVLQALLIAGLLANLLKRWRAERLLTESEGRFRTVADAAPILIWMSGPDKRCEFFNKAWLDFTGRTMEQELGNGWVDGVHPDDREKCVKIYSTAFDAREPFVMQYRLRHHDGEYRWVTDHGVPRYDAQTQFAGYIGGCVDISPFVEKERALEAVEERVALAAETARLGVWELNTGTREIWFSDKARELFQLGPQTAFDCQLFRDRVHPDDRGLRDSAIQQAIDAKGEYEAEYRILLPDGTIRWIGGRGHCVSDERGEMTRLLSVAMDITDRKEAQELFELATEVSPSGTLLVNDKRQIILVNAHIEELFGYGRDELIGKPVENLVPDRLGAGQQLDWKKFMAAPHAQAMGIGREFFVRRKDETEFPVEIGLNPIRMPEGVLVLVTIVDISARKAAEKEAQQSREQIDLLSRVSLLGEMTASLAHELNQPLSAIVSNANAGVRFIDKGNVDLQMLREILVDVGEDGRRAHEVIRNVRNTVKKGSTIRQHVNLNDLVVQVTRMVRADAEAYSCPVHTVLSSDLPPIEGDPVQIQQVLINLVANAFDAMREMPIDRRKVEITTEKNGDKTVCLSVRDHGAGIRETVREKLFQQFFTTKEDGLGMGLAIVRSIIEAHGGKIEAENVDGDGARFYFILPAGKTNPP